MLTIIILITVVLAAIAAIAIAAIRNKTARVRLEIEKKTELLEKALEKESGEIDPVEYEVAFNGMRGSLKFKIVKQLQTGIACILLGIAGLVLEYVVGIDSANIMPVVSAIFLVIGIAYVAVFFFSKSFLKKQLEEEERILSK